MRWDWIEVWKVGALNTSTHNKFTQTKVFKNDRFGHHKVSSYLFAGDVLEVKRDMPKVYSSKPNKINNVNILDMFYQMAMVLLTKERVIYRSNIFSSNT